MNAAPPRLLERAVRRLYVLFPMSWGLRLRLKRALFRRLAPLLQGTPAYQRWQASEQELESLASVARSQAAMDSLASAPLSRRPKRILAAADGSFEAPPAAREPGEHHKLVLVVHDAHPHGAQYLALNLLAELTGELGIDVRVILLGTGPLAASFAQLATVHAVDAADSDAMGRIASGLFAQGYRTALANSLASGRIVPSLAAAGMRVVTLVHEMPAVVRAMGLEQALLGVLTHSARVVVPCADVSSGMLEWADPALVAKACVERPQGLYVRSRHFGGLGRSDAARRLRDRLGLPADARIVLAVGYADERKGVDLFAASLVQLAGRDARVHGVWVGHQDARQLASARMAMAAAGLSDHLHFPGLSFDTDDYYAGANVYALCSREDPFPSVLLEALSVGTPAVAFKGTGGGAALLERLGAPTVPAFDVQAFSEAVEALLSDARLHSGLASQGLALVEREFCFRRYAVDLLALAGIDLPRVTVIVPNFNYARFLRARLASIVAQDLPVYEIIVLDDASTDGSADLLKALRAEMSPVPQLHFARSNGGSVFRQWSRGVELARGDFIWIAEADDLAMPDFLSSLVPEMKSNPSIAMAYCQSRPIDESGTITAVDYLGWTDEFSKDRWKSRFVSSGSEEVRSGLGVKNTIPNVSAAVFRADAIAAVLRDNLEEIAQFRSSGDWLAYLHVLGRGDVLFDPRPGNLHRRHPASVVASQELAAHEREVREVQGRARQLHGGADVAGGWAPAVAGSPTLEPRAKVAENKGMME